MSLLFFKTNAKACRKPFSSSRSFSKIASSGSDPSFVPVEDEFEGKHDYGYRIGDKRFVGQKPTIEYAKSMPTSFSAMRHEQILQLGSEGSHKAHREALIRNIMAVDSIDYDFAEKKVTEIKNENRSLVLLGALPYQVGLVGALAAGIVSYPLIFHLDTVSYFNQHYVTTDSPELSDLETYLEVGSWSWSWMEPVIGQVSFTLLVLQFARNQAINLGIRPYGNWSKKIRADQLVKKFPKYDEEFVRAFSSSDTLYGKD